MADESIPQGAHHERHHHTQLTTCGGRGTQVPFTDSYYVDGASQLCTTQCIDPMPDIEPPF